MAKTILIIDDSPVALEVARDALEENGFAVKTAEGLTEARDIIFGTPQPDLILLDIMMPEVDGDKLCARLKQDERTRHIPVVILSTKERDEIERLATEAGADGFIQKAHFTDSGVIHTISSYFKD